MQLAAAALETQAVASAPLPRLMAAVADDAAAIADLHTRAMDRAFDGVSREFSRMVAAPAAARAFIEGALADPEATVMVARLGSRIVGYAVARGDRLELVAVHPRHRGEGLGTLLLRNVAHEVRGLDVRAPVAQGFFARVAGEEGTPAHMDLLEMGGLGFMGRRMECRDYKVAPRHH